MNIIKEASKYKKQLIKSGSSSRNADMRKCAQHTISLFNSNPNNVPSSLHLTLTDVNKVIESLAEVEVVNSCALLNDIKRLCHNNTMIMNKDIHEYISLLSRYSNALELFVYYNLDDITELDIAKAFLINEISNNLCRVEDIMCV